MSQSKDNLYPSHNIDYALDWDLQDTNALKSSILPPLKPVKADCPSWKLPITAAKTIGHEGIIDILLSFGALSPEEFNSIYGSYLGSLKSQRENLERHLAPSITTGSLPKSANPRAHLIERVAMKDRAACIRSVCELQILTLGISDLQKEHLEYQISHLKDEIRISEPDCTDPLHAALLKAVERNANDDVLALLVAGAKVSALDGDNIPVPNQLLFSAARDGNLLLRGALLDAGVAVVFSYIERFTDLCTREERGRRELSLQQTVKATIMKFNRSSLGMLDCCKILELAVFDSVDRSFTKVFYETLAFPSEDSNPLDAALFVAVKLDSYAMVQFLCGKGANVNSMDNNGVTPLMHAAQQHTTQLLIKSLLTYGANPKLFDNAGETALYKAAANDHFHLANVLFQAGYSPALTEMMAILNLCIFDGKAAAWRAISRTNLCEEAYLASGDVLPSYNVLRGQHLFNSPCQHVRGLFELPAITDSFVC
jgi:ankyrin repeat protein